MSAQNEIRCYANPRVVNGFASLFAAYPVVMLLISMFNGRLPNILPVLAIIAVAVWLFWFASRRGTFIAIDLRGKALYASNFFYRTRSVPVDAIVRIGTRGIFVGLATEIEITYRKPDGAQTTLGYGTTNFLNHPDLQHIFTAIVTLNPQVKLPPELRTL
jgi:hypothetical protein